jgi:hypothetical protein
MAAWGDFDWLSKSSSTESSLALKKALNELDAEGLFGTSDSQLELFPPSSVIRTSGVAVSRRVHMDNAGTAGNEPNPNYILQLCAYLGKRLGGIWDYDPSKREFTLVHENLDPLKMDWEPINVFSSEKSS